MDIDLYEFRGTLKEFDNDDFIEFAEEKGVAVLEVGKTNKETDRKLKEAGYKSGDRVLVVVQ